MLQAIRINPNSSDAWFYHGVFNGEIKNYGEAIADMNKAIELKTDRVSSYTLKGYYEYLDGVKDSACSDFLIGKLSGDRRAQLYIDKYCK
jgi:tetratricopeptide (TPR) repeat protein